MSQLSHAQFPLRRHPNLLVDHRRSRSAAVAEPRGANGEAVTGSGGRLHFGMVAGIKSERWPTSNRNPRPDCLGIRTQTNGIVERFHKTMLDEFYRIAFRKKLYETIEDLQADLDLWMREFNDARPIRASGASERPPCRPSLTR